MKLIGLKDNKVILKDNKVMLGCCCDSAFDCKSCGIYLNATINFDSWVAYDRIQHLTDFGAGSPSCYYSGFYNYGGGNKITVNIIYYDDTGWIIGAVGVISGLQVYYYSAPILDCPSGAYNLIKEWYGDDAGVIVVTV